MVGEKSAKASRRILRITAVVLAVLLLAALIAGMLTEWFGIYGPLTKVALAAKELADAGSVTADFTASILEGTEARGQLQCCWDFQRRDLAASLQLQLGEKSYSYGIVDGYVVWRDYRGKAKSVDISDELESFFDSMESESDLDTSLGNMLKSVFSAAGILEQVDMDAAVDCLKAAFFKCNRTGWLTENAGYESREEDDMTLHVFAPKTGKLLVAMLREFETAFEQHDQYKAALKGLKAQRTELNQNYDLAADFGIRSGRLVRLELEADISGKQFSVQIDLKKIGSTKVDTDLLRQIKEEALS